MNSIEKYGFDFKKSSRQNTVRQIFRVLEPPIKPNLPLRVLTILPELISIIWILWSPVDAAAYFLSAENVIAYVDRVVEGRSAENDRCLLEGLFRVLDRFSTEDIDEKCSA